ncbi:MAG: hypothetical protein MZU79_01875 [Anaerotruncus sp.]|nr:hypothetical protein [Anaerotruncus sp.]
MALALSSCESPSSPAGARLPLRSRLQALSPWKIMCCSTGPRAILTLPMKGSLTHQASLQPERPAIVRLSTVCTERDAPHGLPSAHRVDVGLHRAGQPVPALVRRRRSGR